MSHLPSALRACPPGYRPGYPVVVDARVPEARAAQLLAYLGEGGFLSAAASQVGRAAGQPRA